MARDPPVTAPARPGLPLWLVLELTYRCPLHCPYCSNPVDFAHHARELATHEWLRVLAEARALGAVQLGLSGGEPLLREDLELLVAEAHRLGYYINLITSGVGLSEPRIQALHAAGLDHIQLSFQHSARPLNDFLGGARTFDLKMKAAALIRRYRYPMVLNVVIHRLNIDHVEQILEMALALGATSIELASAQYYGWALLNRSYLMPSAEQVQRCERTVRGFRERIGEQMRIYWVVPDYFERRPKPCMNGFGSLCLVVAPDGLALPCHAARVLPGLVFPNVREANVDWIWKQSPAFNHFRGDAWMREPCRSCPEKTRDLGGCRCQAYLLTGDAENADPVCDRSAHHHLVRQAVAGAAAAPNEEHPVLFFRNRANSLARR